MTTYTEEQLEKKHCEARVIWTRSARSIRRGTESCLMPAKWQADVHSGTSLVRRRLCNNHLHLYQECNILKEYRPLEVTPARQSA